MQTAPAPAYRSPPAPERALRRWRADLAEAEAVALRVRRAVDGLALGAAVGPLGASRLLDAAVTLLACPRPLSALRAFGCAVNLAVGLGCAVLLAWWAVRLRPERRADLAELRGRAAELRADWPGVVAGEPFGEQVYGRRLAALERLAA